MRNPIKVSVLLFACSFATYVHSEEAAPPTEKIYYVVYALDANKKVVVPLEFFEQRDKAADRAAELADGPCPVYGAVIVAHSKAGNLADFAKLKVEEIVMDGVLARTDPTTISPRHCPGWLWAAVIRRQNEKAGIRL